MEEKPSKKKRSPNFSKKEEEKLLKLVYRERAIIENRQLSMGASKKKEAAWEKLAVEFNAGNMHQFRRRSVKEIKEKYANMKRYLRKLQADERKNGYSFESTTPNGSSLSSTKDKDYIFHELCCLIGMNVEELGLETKYDINDHIEDTNIYKSPHIIETDPLYEVTKVGEYHTETSQDTTNSSSILNQSSQWQEQHGNLRVKATLHEEQQETYDDASTDNTREYLTFLKKQILEEQLKKIRAENEHAEEEHKLKVQILGLELKTKQLQYAEMLKK